MKLTERRYAYDIPDCSSVLSLTLDWRGFKEQILELHVDEMLGLYKDQPTSLAGKPLYAAVDPVLHRVLLFPPPSEECELTVRYQPWPQEV
jgi:hypothetical protein